MKLKIMTLVLIDETAWYSEKWKTVFLLWNKDIRLLLTSPVIAAADVRTLCRESCLIDKRL